MNDGGPAFPKPTTVRPSGEIEWGNDGMTLRDYFSAKAMQACINDSWRNAPEMQEKTYHWLGEGIAKDAYAIADAMLVEREKTK